MTEERSAVGERLPSVGEDDIRFEVDKDFKIRVYANDSGMLDVACRLCSHRVECEGTGKGLMARCSCPCG